MASVLSLLLGAVVTAVLIGGPANAGQPDAYDPACAPASAPAPETDPVRILLAGDSLTNGKSGDYTWRYFFDRHLRADDVNFDFVGPWSDVIDINTWEWGSHEYAACDFDQDHDSRGGAQLAEQLMPTPYDASGRSGIAWATDYYAADVVVGFFGYNDLIKSRKRLDGTTGTYTPAQLLANAHTFVNQVRSENPAATIVMVTIPWASIPNPPDENKLLVQRAPVYNTLLEQQAPSWSLAATPGTPATDETPGTPGTPASKVVVADATQYWHGYPDTYDGSHATAQGEVEIAAAIANAFSTLGIGGPATVPPTMPVGPLVVPQLTATPSSSAVTLTWGAVPGATRMLLSCREVGAEDWTQLPEVPTVLKLVNGVYVVDEVASYRDVVTTCGSALSNGHHYEFRAQAAKVRTLALNADGSGRYSNTATVTMGGGGATPTPTLTPTPTPTPTPTVTPTVTPTPTATPTTLGRVQGLVATTGNRTVQLTWKPVAGATGYTVGWRKSGDSFRAVAASGTGYRFTDLVGWQSYDFIVRALASPGAGPYTSPVSVTPTGSLAAPVRPHLVRVSGHRVRISWHKVALATRYQVQYRVGAGPWQVLGYTAGTSYTSRALVKGRAYGFRVRTWHQQVAGGISAGNRITAG